MEEREDVVSGGEVCTCAAACVYAPVCAFCVVQLLCVCMGTAAFVYVPVHVCSVCWMCVFVHDWHVCIG